jgi:hypothetical protein
MSATHDHISAELTMSDMSSPFADEPMVDYQPNVDQESDSGDKVEDPNTPTERAQTPGNQGNDRRKPHRALPEPFSNLKQRKLDEQVSFIIFTRDNNTPDPYGRNSSAFAPLPWTAVAEVYNETFRVGQSQLGMAAMEKRARQHRDTWMAARPDYPRSITYTIKPKIPMPKRPRATKVKQMKTASKPPLNQPPGVQSTKSQALEKELDAIRKAYKKLLRRAFMMFEGDSRASRVAGWVPPEEDRNADVDASFHCVEPI